MTRIVIAWRLRAHVHRRRATHLLLGSVPGIAAGLIVRDAVDTDVLKAGVGIVALLAVAHLLVRSSDASPRRVPGDVLFAGVAGGFLGTTTSLNGVVPAMLLAHVDARPLSFIADLAVFFVGSSTLMLAVLVGSDPALLGALGRYLPFWLPLAVAGNLAGSVLAPRLPRAAFRRLALAVIAASGCVALATAW